MRKTILASAAVLGVASLSVAALNAQPAPRPGAINVEAIAGGAYTADPSHSMVMWHVSHLGFNDYYGIFGDVTGTLNLDKDNPNNSSVDVMIPIASVTVPSAGLKDHLMRAGADGAAPDFFGPNPAPAHFKSTTVHHLTGTIAEIMGDLTMNGQTHPVTIQAEMSGMGTNGMNQKKTLGFHGTTTIDRTQFGVNFGTAFGIPAQVPLEITIAFEQ